MNNKREYGSITVIVIVIAVVALLGVIGYVLFTNLGLISLDKSDLTNQTTNDTKKSKNLNLASFDKSFGISMNFKYPKSWTIDKKHSGTFPVKASESSAESFTVTSPDKKYSVAYRLGAGGGIGGACPEEEAGLVVAIETTEVRGWKGSELVRTITKTRAGKYRSDVRLMAAGTLSGVKVGDNECKLFGLDTIAVPSMQFELTLLGASVHLKNEKSIIDGTSNQGVDSEKAARQLFSGATFDEAKAILLSTTLK